MLVHTICLFVGEEASCERGAAARVAVANL